MMKGLTIFLICAIGTMALRRNKQRTMQIDLIQTKIATESDMT